MILFVCLWLYIIIIIINTIFNEESLITEVIFIRVCNNHINIELLFNATWWACIYHLNKGLNVSPKFILVVQEHSHVSLIACEKGARTAFISIILFLLRTAHKQKCWLQFHVLVTRGSTAGQLIPWLNIGLHKAVVTHCILILCLHSKCHACLQCALRDTRTSWTRSKLVVLPLQKLVGCLQTVVGFCLSPSQSSSCLPQLALLCLSPLQDIPTASLSPSVAAAATRMV